MKTKLPNRYLLLVLGTMIQFCYGLAYVWSVFQPYAKEKYSLDTAAANMPFGIFMGLFAIGNLSGGYLQKKINSVVIISIGSIVMCLGLVATAYVPVTHPWLLNLCYGGISGFGCGCAYNTLLATIQRWFPDKRGLVTGIIICATGAFGLIINPIANYFLEDSGFCTAMLVVAGILMLICITCCWFIKNPPAGYMSDYKPARIPVSSRQFTVKEMLRTKQYYIITITMMLAVPAYFLINPMLMSLGTERGLTVSAALSGVMLASVMNTAGRLLAPWTSDRAGRKGVLLLLFSVSMVTILSLTAARGVLFLVLIALLAFSYGGFMGMYPTVSADYFGIKNAGMNYGAVLMGYAISSVGSPYLVKAVQATQMGTVLSFIIAAAASFLGFLLILLLRKPE